MYEQFIRDRITQLRLQKNVSERQMSFDLGHGPSYINSISTGKTLPSLKELIYIWEYFKITPAQFFDNVERDIGFRQRKAIDLVCELSQDDTNLVIDLLTRLIQK